MKRKIILPLVVFIILATPINAFSGSYPATVHEHLTNESKEVWNLTPYEIKVHLNNSQDITIYPYIPEYYNLQDDIITGSAEEDAPVTRSFNHFWEPDNPENGIYNDGLRVLWVERDSSYTKALEYWKTKVIPLYLKGEINESYYYLGRVAHLLEDAAVPEHVHLDCHPGSELIGWTCDASSGDGGNDDSSLEKYTANRSIFHAYDGSAHSGKQYDYDNLIQNFDWSLTDAREKQNIELFRLFWYTAQKTQYFASDDADGNDTYTTLSGQTYHFSPSLWSGENVVLINKSVWLAQDDITNSGTNITRIANATIPHAMRAVAGLYHLFWDAVHTDWPTDHHDFRRTGFTLLKGDINKDSEVDADNIALKQNIQSDILIRPSVADLDGNGHQEVVMRGEGL